MERRISLDPPPRGMILRSQRPDPSEAKRRFGPWGQKKPKAKHGSFLPDKRSYPDRHAAIQKISDETYLSIIDKNEGWSVPVLGMEDYTETVASPDQDRDSLASIQSQSSARTQTQESYNNGQRIAVDTEHKEVRYATLTLLGLVLKESLESEHSRTGIKPSPPSMESLPESRGDFSPTCLSIPSYSGSGRIEFTA